MTGYRASHSLAGLEPTRNFRLEPREAFVNQEITNVSMRRIFISVARRLSHTQNGAGYFQFTFLCALADALNYMAVTVARGKIHPRIDAGRIFRQLGINQTYCFKKVFPIKR